MAATQQKISRPFAAKFPGTCSVSGRKFPAGAQVQFVGSKVALVGAVAPVVTGKKSAPRSVAAAKVVVSDGHCGFCRVTKGVTVCAMCGWTAAPAQPVALKVAAPAVQVVTAPTGDVRARTVDAIRIAMGGRDLMTATALVVGLTDLAWKGELLNSLTAMDQRCSARGWIMDEELSVRESILAQALASLGVETIEQLWTAPAPSPSPAAHAKVADLANDLAAAEMSKRLQLTDGVAAPLQAGDWRSLWMRVQAGTLTEDQAKEFGALWMKAGL